MSISCYHLIGLSYDHYTAISIYRYIRCKLVLRPANKTAFGWVIRWIITDITKFVQFPDALVISRYRCDPGISHQFFTGHRKGTDKFIPLPLDKQSGKSTIAYDVVRDLQSVLDKTVYNKLIENSF